MAERQEATRTTDGSGDRGQADGEPQGRQQERMPEQRAASSDRPMGREPSSEPDVHLDVPRLHVGEISVDVDRLEAHLALRAQLANILNLVAGAHVGVDQVRIEVKDVDAEAMLNVRLANTYNILDRTLTTLDDNPEIVEKLTETADTARTGDAGGQASKRGGPVSELASGMGDALGDVSGTLGDKLSGVAGKARPKRPEGDAEQSERDIPASRAESDASSDGSRFVKGAAVAGTAAAAGLAGAALLRSRPRRRILGIPIGRKSGLTALAEEIGKASNQVSNATEAIQKVGKASETIDRVRDTARKALP